MAYSKRTLPTVGEPAMASAPQRLGYGTEPKQFGELQTPEGAGPHAVVMFIHGGFWRSRWDLSLARPQAVDLAAEGVATWNIEYRGVGDQGGGFPGTLADVAAAIDHLSVLVDRYRLDPERVVVVGHSAGGHLAMWLGQRCRLRAGMVGESPLVVPRLVIGQAPVSDLHWAFERSLGSGAVLDMMGGSPDERPAAYAVADPARLLPPAVDQLIIHGDHDDDVPIGATRSYARLVASRDLAGDDTTRVVLTVEECEGADHFDVIDPSHDSWSLAKVRIAAI